MSDQPVRTTIRTRTSRLSFQRYLVAERARPIVRAVTYRGATTARPAPGVLAAIRDADAVIIAPSNPVLEHRTDPRRSRDPTPRSPSAAARSRPSRRWSGARRDRPLARLLRRFGYPASSLGIARCYRPFLDALVIDRSDHADAAALERAGCRPILADTMFTTPARAERASRARLLDALGLA